MLHDAFFKHQKKPTYLVGALRRTARARARRSRPPAQTTVGDLYYEGREFETKMASQKPGQLVGRASLVAGRRVVTRRRRSRPSCAPRSACRTAIRRRTSPTCRQASAAANCAVA